MGILAAIGVGAVSLFSTGAAAAMGSGILASMIGGALVGAAIGGITSAITGGSILEGVLFGAVGGAVVGGVAAWAGGATMFAEAGAGTTQAAGGISGATQTIGSGAGVPAKEALSIGAAFSSATEGASGWSIAASFAKEGIGAYMKSESQKATAAALIESREDQQAHAKDMTELQAALMGGGGGGSGAGHDPANMARVAEDRRQYNLAREDRLKMAKARGAALGGALDTRKEYVTRDKDGKEIERASTGDAGEQVIPAVAPEGSATPVDIPTIEEIDKTVGMVG